MNDGPPEQKLVRAIDVKPHRWAIWCTVEGDPKPFANEIELRSWSEDGKRIVFMLGTHNFLSAEPEDLILLVPLDEEKKAAVYGPSFLADSDTRDAVAMAKRPVPTEPCPRCGGSGKVPCAP